MTKDQESDDTINNNNSSERKKHYAKYTLVLLLCQWFSISKKRGEEGIHLASSAAAISAAMVSMEPMPWIVFSRFCF